MRIDWKFGKKLHQFMWQILPDSFTKFHVVLFSFLLKTIPFSSSQDSSPFNSIISQNSSSDTINSNISQEKSQSMDIRSVNHLDVNVITISTDEISGMINDPNLTEIERKFLRFYVNMLSDDLRLRSSVDISAVEYTQLLQDVFTSTTIDSDEERISEYHQITKNIEKIQEYMKTTLLKHSFDSYNFDSDHDLQRSFWSILWSSLSIDKGPWSFQSEEKIKWKRDNTFCYAFCPSKLRKDFNYQDFSNLLDTQVEHLIESPNESANMTLNEPTLTYVQNASESDIPLNFENDSKESLLTDQEKQDSEEYSNELNMNDAIQTTDIIDTEITNQNIIHPLNPRSRQHSFPKSTKFITSSLDASL